MLSPELMVSPELTATVAKARERLENVLGVEETRKVWNTRGSASGAPDPQDGHELLRFGQAMIVYGGITEMVGRSLCVHAIFCGAKLN
jgi:hypothetical protein